jgi:hypothetical protein
VAVGLGSTVLSHVSGIVKSGRHLGGGATSGGGVVPLAQREIVHKLESITEKFPEEKIVDFLHCICSVLSGEGHEIFRLGGSWDDILIIKKIVKIIP